MSARTSGGAKALEAASAAHHLLVALGTDPAHGLLPPHHPSGGISSQVAGDQKPAPAGDTSCVAVWYQAIMLVALLSEHSMLSSTRLLSAV